MSNEVKRYDPINSDGTCGMCIEDADYGAYVEYADYAALEAELATVKKVAYGNMELLDENQKLKAELAKLHAGQESLLLNLADQKRQADEYRAMWAKAVASSPQPSAVPDGWKLVPVEPTEEMLESDFISCHCGHDFSPALFDHVWHKMLAAAPATPATEPSVNQQLLEALENTATWIEQLPVPTVGAAGQLVKIDKAIAAAREGGKI